MTPVSATIGAFALALLPAPGSCATAAEARTPIVGVLLPATQQASAPFADGLRQGLSNLGYVDGVSVRFDIRYADGRVDRFAQLAARLLRDGANVIVAAGPMVAAATRATTSVPIVMVGVNDPVAEGFVVSLAHPGRNVTGLSAMNGDLAEKALQLLAESVPAAKRVGVLWDPSDPIGPPVFEQARASARALGLALVPLKVQRADEFERAFTAAGRERVDALYVVATTLTVTHRREIAGLESRHRLPAIHLFGEFTRAGALMSYGPSLPHLYRQAAVYVARILKGARAADLPVERPVRFELVLNLKAARTLGLSFPQSILLRADEVIE